MRLTLEDVLKYVDLNDPIEKDIQAQEETWRVKGFYPKIEDIDKFRKYHISVGDIYFLEPPRTYADILHRKEFYGVTAALEIEKLETI